MRMVVAGAAVTMSAAPAAGAAGTIEDGSAFTGRDRIGMTPADDDWTGVAPADRPWIG
ncbi:hypothetical protein [Nonomuraea sp. NPDC050643]|uniref:hypothetical protein n=1 Tax=Nonomuraea sp. NPDC050643 TaxID=3155660 RepID=UPI0033DE9211